MNFGQAVAKLTEDMSTRIKLAIGRGVALLVDDSSKAQTIQTQMLADEVDSFERLQNYGFTSVPHPGAEVIYISVGGNRDHGVIIVAEDRRYRLTGMALGEVAVFTDEGDSIILKRGNQIEVNTTTLTVNASDKATFNTPLLEVLGNIHATGNITDLFGSFGSMSMANMRMIYNGHDHHENNTGNTNQPNQQM